MTAPTDDDPTIQTLAEINQRLTDLSQDRGYEVFQSRGEVVPSYAVLQLRFRATVVAIRDIDVAVAYMTRRPKATEDSLAPGNALVRVDGSAVECLAAVTSYKFIAHIHRDLVPDDFNKADRALREFVAGVVALVDVTA
jgi:hypothetical protein